MNKNILFGLLLSTALTSSAALADDTHATVGLGIEGFSDRYHEPEVDVNTNSTYGSITGYYAYEQSNAFGALDGRVSYGTTDYKSPSGKVSGIPEWEFEGRGRLGYSFPLWGGNLSPYTGLGVRYFMQEGKNRYTTNFAFAYDRRILQAYVPIGMSYAYTTSGGWTITPQAEFDLLLYGDVNSRLSNVGPTYYNISNRQSMNSGYGVRGELMFGKSAKGYSWQFGPFARYWNVSDSKLTTDPSNNTWLEPKNDRTQIGLAARVLW